MKRYFSVILAAVMLLSFCAGCGQKENVDDAYAGVAADVMAGTGDHVSELTAQTDAAEQTEQTEQTELDQAQEQTLQDQTEELQTETEQLEETEAEGASDAAAETEEETEPVVEEEDKLLHPLTGEETETDYTAFRPYAVMIDNGSGALPQDGISYADILYEVTAYAGGSTRCMGIYQDMSVTDVIGGVRSCRSQFVDIALSYDAIFLHYGGSDEGKARINKTDCDHVDGMGSSWFYRDSWRSNHIGYSHSVVVDTEAVLTNIEGKGFRIKHEDGYSCGLDFADEVALTEAQDAVKAVVSIGGSKTTTLEYNADTGLYMASQYDDIWIDRLTEQQLSFTNAIFIHMDSHVSQGVLQIHDTLEGGTGYYMVGGKIAEITWSRESLDDPYQYFYADGTPVTLQAGKTYVGVYTAGGWVEWEGPAAEVEAEAETAE